MADAKPSKSAKKRAAAALQKLGEKLILLSREQLAAIDLDPELRDAVHEARNINAHGALRRQKQLIGKLMRGMDPSPLQAALARVAEQERPAKDLFRCAEAWRDRITAEGASALAEFCAATGRRSDQLEQALKDYGNARSDSARKHTRRRIFRHVHDELTRAAAGPGGTGP